MRGHQQRGMIAINAEIKAYAKPNTYAGSIYPRLREFRVKGGFIQPWIEDGL